MKLDVVSSQPVIEATRFVLRPVRRSDAGLLGLYTADERVARFTRSIPHPLPPGATEAFIQRAQNPDRSEDVWVMDGAEQGLSEVLGVIALDRMEREQSEIGYWVAPAFWNTGIASEAVSAMIAANPQGCRTFFAEVFQDNPGSARVLTNAGFEYLGDAEAFSVARGGKVATWTYLRKLG
ncbi:GNAT family N-acetyltransferase [Rhodovulum euryhalinum]|uniref:RimJ/RimL family protein N-acetyltransferase n=1 Tax=Rhodovulum euryhalinum TaxID=35805 RepID=A0A4R2KHC2_9RHOB|nr:GNAT family N-acetyltransferase [Rhodovulum euryhalinum]TCO72544.1 RimJ/RimL family protein N-acetyltransferase [Rhodovulum euryhalinum]